MAQDPCLDLPGTLYFNLVAGAGSITLPTATLINEPFDARWLIVTPGQANQGGTAAAGSVQWRLYKGLYLPAGGWKTGYSTPPVNPIAVGQFSDGQCLIPYADVLQMVLEIVGIGAFGANSQIEMTITPFTV